MGKNLANPDTIRSIRKLANNPEKVKITNKALYGMWGEDLTKEEVCETIREWIDNSGEVYKPPGGSADQHYVIQPIIGQKKFYIRLIILEPNRPDKTLLIISLHPSL
jgi:hypothetical protein